MAKQKVNKTALIKAQLDKNPDAKPAEIAATLKKHGITAAYVSAIKFNLGKKVGQRKRKAGRPKGTATAAKVAVNDLVKAKEFADEIGGVEQAQALLETVAKLR